MMKRDYRSAGLWHGQSTEDDQSIDSLLYIIAYHSSPVLEKQKPAVLLNFGNEPRRRLNDIWRENRDRIPGTENFQYDELRRTPERTFVLFYHPNLLQNVLQEKAAAQYLLSCGYRRGLSLNTALADLKSRFEQRCPHEIGIFLGIPLPDVLGFIENGGKNALAEGYWKVYHDPGFKLTLFNRYQEAQHCFLRLMKTGKGPREYLIDKSILCTG
ncbi:MAG TPA: DUF3793 domain-containing protein [Firmicutes bacterium]|jgi:hypothetical protein|nr:DUF3793 domain-containing protein [Bacillota bacterium]